MKHKARQHASAVHVHLDARDAGVGHLDAEQPVERHIKHVAYRDADGTGVANDQHVPPGVVREDIFPGGKDAVAKRSECFAARRRVTHGVVPKRVSRSGSVASNSSAVRPSHSPKPISMSRTSTSNGSASRTASSSANTRQRASGEVRIASQAGGRRRPRASAPSLSLRGSSVWPRYLLPPTGSPWRIKSIVVGVFISRLFPDTPASAKVAISLCSAHASRSSGTAVAAPLPSPRRIPVIEQRARIESGQHARVPGLGGEAWE